MIDDWSSLRINKKNYTSPLIISFNNVELVKSLPNFVNHKVYQNLRETLWNIACNFFKHRWLLVFFKFLAGFWLDLTLLDTFFPTRLLTRLDWIFPTRLDCRLDSIEFSWLESIRNFCGYRKTITNFSFSSLKNTLKVLYLKVLPTFHFLSK